MKTPAILIKKFKTVTRPRTDYLDETSKFHQEVHSRYDKSSGVDHHDSDILLNYIAKEGGDTGNVGKLFAGGYFRREIQAKFHQKPERMPNSQISEEIQKIADRVAYQYGPFRQKYYGHHLAISLSDDTMRSILMAGKSIDQFLVENVRETMTRFQAKYHSNDPIGYGFGIHHDTEHRHAHVYLCGRTENGKWVGLSQAKHKSHESNKNRNNQLEFFRETSHKIAEEAIAKIKADSNKTAQKVERRIELAQEINSRVIGKAWDLLARTEMRSNELLRQREKLRAERERVRVETNRDLDIMYSEKLFYSEQLKKYFDELKFNRQISNKKIYTLDNMIRRGLSPDQIIAAMPEVLRIMPSISKDMIVQSKLNRTISTVHIQTIIKNKNMKIQSIDEELRTINIELENANNLISKFVKYAPQYAHSRRDPKFAERLVNIIREYQNSGDSVVLERNLLNITRIPPSAEQMAEFMAQVIRNKHQMSNTSSVNNKINSSNIETEQKQKEMQKPNIEKSHAFLLTKDYIDIIKKHDKMATLEYEGQLIELKKFAVEKNMNWYEKKPNAINNEPGQMR